MWYLQSGDTTGATPAPSPRDLCRDLQPEPPPSTMCNRSTGATHPHPCCGTQADTHLGAPEGHSRVIPPWEEGVMVLMMKQSQCVNLERPKENIPIPAGRAAAPHVEPCHEHIPEAEHDTRAGKASRAPGWCQLLWVRSAVCLASACWLSHSSLPFPPQLPAAAEAEL